MNTRRRNKPSDPDRPPHPHRSYLGARGFDAKLEFDPTPPDSPGPWLKLVPATDSEPAIGILQHASGFLATFSWELSSATPKGDVESTPGAKSAPSEPTIATRILQRTLASLLPTERLCWRYCGGLEPEAGARVSVHITGSATASGVDAVLDQARALQSKARVVLNAFAHSHGFTPLREPLVPTGDVGHAYDLRAASLFISPSPEIGYTPDGKAGAVAALPAPPAMAIATAEDLPHLLAQMSPPIVVEAVVSGLNVAPAGLAALGRLHRDIANANFRLELDTGNSREDFLAERHREYAVEYLAHWSREPAGYTVGCRVSGGAPVAESLLKLIGEEMFQGRPVLIGGASSPTQAPAAGGRARKKPPAVDAIDLAGSFHVRNTPPPLMPNLGVLERFGMPRLFTNPSLQLPANGIHAGAVIQHGEREEVLIPEAHRDRHCYIVGATGTGKSTLLRHLITQDMQRGAGVVVLDPHGDLFGQLLECVPANRAGDLVILDPTRPERVASINMLDCPGPNVALQQNFVINEFSSMFERMYNMRQAGGPGFEQYMRFALMLLMNAPKGQATLADLPRVFDDEDFRRRLLEGCPDRFVREFWAGAERRSGEQALSNWTGYVTSKFSPFISNPLVRPIISQPESTIDFRTVMDRQQILLVNLSKGMLGERDSRFLGSLVVTKLLAATLARAAIPKARRKTAFLYIDEFQNFTSETLATVLSEARKFGLSLTIAHQHVSQLPQAMFESVMGNTATKLIFRVGMIDAERLEAYSLPSFDRHDLVALPDFHAACTMVSGSAPLPPFVCETFMGKHESTPEKAALAARLATRSAQKYGRDAAEVERLLQEAPLKERSAATPSTVPLLGGFLAARMTQDTASLAEPTDQALRQWRSNLAKRSTPTVAPGRGKFYRAVNGSLLLAIATAESGKADMLVVEGDSTGRWSVGKVYTVSADGRYDLDAAAAVVAGLGIAAEVPLCIEGYDWSTPPPEQDFNWLAENEQSPPRWARLDLSGGGFFRTLNGSLVFAIPEPNPSRRVMATVCAGGHGDKTISGEKAGETYTLTDQGQFLLSPNKADEIMTGAPVVFAQVAGMGLAVRLRLLPTCNPA